MIVKRIGYFTLILAIGLSGCRPTPAQPQSEGDINAADMRARISFLASDELRGRATPSPGLEIAADYVESEFRRFGLDAPPRGYVQRYRLVRADVGEDWWLVFSRGDRRAWLSHKRDFWGLPWAAGTIEGSLQFVGAAPPAEAARGVEPEIWVAELTRALSVRDWLREARVAGASGIIFLFDPAMDPFLPVSTEAETPLYDLDVIEAGLPGLLMTEETFNSALQRLGFEVQTASTLTAAPGRADARLRADLNVETLMAPNVVAIARGEDPDLRDEYVLVTAHMDHLGIGRPVAGDSIYNGADDNASGTAAVLEVAEAIAALQPPPRRSIIFALLSGEERGLLGSSWFVENPPVPLDRIIANLNIDMIGRNWEDTISVIGKPYSTLGATVDSVAAAHPDLGLVTVGDLWPNEGFFFRSDHFNFAREGIPAVFFFNGVHPDYHQPSDEVDKIKFEKASRVASLIYRTTLALANADGAPRWDPRARDRIVDDNNNNR